MKKIVAKGGITYVLNITGKQAKRIGICVLEIGGTGSGSYLEIIEFKFIFGHILSIYHHQM